MTKFVALSGTVMRRSLLDFGHILRWCLKDGAPIPSSNVELEEWAKALDERVNELDRYEPGALREFCGGCDSIEGVRRGFRQRLLETPGVVATTGNAERVDCSLYIRALQYDVEPITEQHFKTLRKLWETPDGWPLSQAVDVWRHARELALGLHYVWDPRPPKAWLEARKEWCAFVRQVLARSRTLDSELQVSQACDAGSLPNKALETWRAVKGTFKPNTVAVWHDDSALQACLEWMRCPGVVWTEHSLFAERLAKESGCKYYGPKGLAADGSFIDDADPKQSAVVSLDANREGRNLQRIWNRCLFTCIPEGWDVCEQAIGRFHRTGQLKDEVEVDVLLGCIEHHRAFRRAMSGAVAVEDTAGTYSRLLMAEVDWPNDLEVETYTGARWR